MQPASTLRGAPAMSEIVVIVNVIGHLLRGSSVSWRT
jgi:hypothetical protein